MRISAQAARFLIAVVCIALLATLGGLGCGKKGDSKQASAGGGNMMPGMGGGAGGVMPGGGGMPGMGGGAPGGGMPGMPSMGGGAPGGGMAAGGAAPAAAAPAPSGSVDPEKSPAAPSVTPAPRPSARQLALVSEAVWTLRIMMSPNVPPPPPGKELTASQGLNPSRPQPRISIHYD